MADALISTLGPSAAMRDQLGQPARRADPAVADRGAVCIGEAAGDRGAREVDDRVDAGQQSRIGVVRIPLPFIGFGGRMPDQADHPMAAGGQEGGSTASRPARRTR